MLERQIAHCGVPPRQVAADGGYASQDNLTAAKALGVTDIAFHKKRGLAVEDHGQEPLGLSQAAQLPRRDRGRDFLPQASLRFGTLHLARARSFQDLHLVRGGGAQTWCCSPASNRHRPRLRPATSMTSAKSNQLVHPRSSNDSFGLRHYFKANTVSLPDNHRMPRPSKLPKNVRLWTGTS